MPVGGSPSDAFNCNPRQPGRADREAAVYAAAMSGPRNAGWTCEAIREALAHVGIQLSTSTLRCEVAPSGQEVHRRFQRYPDGLRKRHP
jgi:hypothetical protein